jgi:5'-nucleotidase / UDP-sugar diphosphatase
MLNLKYRLAGALPALLIVVLALPPLNGALGQPKTITILHTNDMHASFLPHEATWVREKPKPLVGGFPALQYLIDSIRHANPPVLLLDAGDVMTGNPITDRPYKGADGGALFEMMNMMGYDVWCPGNHDFDISQKNFRGLVGIARFPTLCANLVDDQGQFQFGQLPYRVVERGGLKIGIIGIMSQYLYNLVNQNNLVGIRVLSPEQTLKKYARELQPRTDLLIALTHEGVDEDSLLALAVPEVNVIIGGHSHTRLRSAKRVNGVLIVQAGSNAENLGYFSLTVANHRVAQYDAHLIQAWPRTNMPRTRLAEFADSIQASIDLEYSVVLGTLKQDWVRVDKSQSAIGTFIAEAQRVAVHADVAFMNSQGIRKDMSAGPVTKRDLFEILPFRNVLGTFQLRGYELRQILQYYVQRRPSIQIAGISATWKREADGSTAFPEILVQGAPLEEARVYVCVASDYFIGEAKRYVGMEILNPVYLNTTLFSAAEQAFMSQSPVAATVLYTIQEIH